MAGRIIAFVGQKGSGKDTAALPLIRAGYKRFAFANHMKYVIARGLDIPVAWMHDPSKKEMPLLHDGKTIRQAMQYIGEKFKEFTPDCWASSILDACDGSNMVITDLRYDIEFQMATLAALDNNMTLDLIRIERSGLEDVDDHSSEHEWRKLKTLATIHNDGTEDDLHAIIAQNLLIAPGNDTPGQLTT